jgi:hypothetical protein
MFSVKKRKYGRKSYGTQKGNTVPSLLSLLRGWFGVKDGKQ